MFYSTAFLHLVGAGMMAVRVTEAGVIPGMIARINLRAEGSLESRQTGTNPAGPPQCETQCDPITSVVAAGCQISTCCQASFEMGYFNCLECVGQAFNLTDYSPDQLALDGKAHQCMRKCRILASDTYLSRTKSKSATVLRFKCTCFDMASSVTRPGLPLSISFLSTLSQATVTSIPLQPHLPRLLLRLGLGR
ncbi:hypothetical protein BDZ97DRAFT_1028278 [Flammula alnicola]|nr:hypothetical protein BDZ97DRAFT_1028278 [Flammula alnicola]